MAFARTDPFFKSVRNAEWFKDLLRVGAEVLQPTDDRRPGLATIYSIGPTFVAALAEQGVRSFSALAELTYPETQALAEKLEVSPAVVRRWKQIAELIEDPDLEIGPVRANLLALAGITNRAQLQRRLHNDDALDALVAELDALARARPPQPVEGHGAVLAQLVP